MVVVDSSVWIGHFRNDNVGPVWKLRSIANLDQVVVGNYIMLEVLRGARDDRHALELERILRQFRLEPLMDDVLAVHAATNYRILRNRGITVATIDLVVATFCVDRGHTLLHDDSNFDLVAPHLGLRVL